MDVDNSAWATYISEVYSYFSQYSTTALIPEEYANFLTSTFNKITDLNGPSLDLVEETDTDPITGETVKGYKISFDGVTYDNQSDLMAAVGSSSYYSGDAWVTGSLGYGDGNTVAILRRNLYIAMNPSAVPPETITDQRIPGTTAVLEASVDGDNGYPSIGLFMQNVHIDILPRTDKLTDPDSENLSYINYTIIKSSSGDILFKCHRSNSPSEASLSPESTPGSTMHSINHYVTSLNEEGPRVYDYVPPLVHHANLNDEDARIGGFGVIQYDYTGAYTSWTSMEGSYSYAIVLMNTNGAPLIFNAGQNFQPYRTYTTSTYSISGSVHVSPGSESVNDLKNENLYRPVVGANDFPLPDDCFLLAPFITPASGPYAGRWSKWMMIADPKYIRNNGESSAGAAFRKIRSGTSIYLNDHGFCLNGGMMWNE